MDNEPKKDFQSSAEEMFDKLTTPEPEQPQESSPETEQVETKVEGESDSLKTPSTPEVPTENKGFASHPKWIERENKLKETRELLKQKEAEAQRYSKLLDDPEVYGKWLKQQGYSDAHIAEALREKGYQPKSDTNQVSNQAQAIAERACAKLGWDINRLNAEQKAYINDSVSLTMAIIQEAVAPMIDQRVKPMEEVSNEWNQQKQFNADEIGVQKLAKEEFPDSDWETIIKPAIAKYLQELDEKDPQRLIKLSYEDIYYRATRPLLKELNDLKGRQEVRNTNKQNLRPLGNAPATKTGEPVAKGKSARDVAEAFLDAQGVR